MFRRSLYTSDFSSFDTTKCQAHGGASSGYSNDFCRRCNIHITLPTSSWCTLRIALIRSNGIILDAVTCLLPVSPLFHPLNRRLQSAGWAAMTPNASATSYGNWLLVSLKSRAADCNRNGSPKQQRCRWPFPSMVVPWRLPRSNDLPWPPGRQHTSASRIDCQSWSASRRQRSCKHLT